ncbi:mercuric reductase [Gemmatimonas sp.]|uniref:mercuric reductase n=1 Tax=Gemmatimonas sp. TaxID=1962908 RepID=UPI003983B3DA
MTPSATPVRADAIFIGTGQATPALATALAGGGERVVVFEGGMVGGSCVNVGCTPTKTLRKSARVAHMVARAGDFGVQVSGVHIDFAAAMQRVARVVEASRNGLTRWIDDTTGVTLVREWGAFAGRENDQFVVQGEHTTAVAPRVYLNTGTRPAVPPIPGLADGPLLTNESIMALTERPRHLVILGGSYIGLEMGQIFRRLGSDVTILEAGPAVASREDGDVSARIAAFLGDEGVTIHTHSAVERVEWIAEDGVPHVVVHARHRTTGEVRHIDASHVLVATGRLPNTERLRLSTVGVTLDAQGFIPVNGRLETNVPGVWALGDVNRRGAFTHTSYQDHEIVLANQQGGARTADGRVSTYAMFTDPPLGRVGLSETEAREQSAGGRRFLVATHEMKNVSRAKEESETLGVIRLLVDAETHRFAGATLLGIGADEIVQIIGAMMAADAPYQVLRDALPVHPTVTEFLPTILGKLTPLT